MRSLFLCAGGELRGKAEAMRDQLRRQELAVARLDAAMHPKGWFTKVDPNTLWHAIETAREVSCVLETRRHGSRKDVTPWAFPMLHSMFHRILL